jgi:adhesin transport system outer membrane protein
MSWRHMVAVSCLAMLSLASPSRALAESLDPVLDALIDAAMRRSPLLDAKRSEVAAAGHDLKAAKWQYAPSVSAQFQQGSGSNKDVYGSALRADQRLYAGGRLDADRDGAASRRSSAMLSLQESGVSLALQIASAYQSLQTAQGQQAAIAVYRNQLADLNATIGRRIESGVSSSSEQSLMNARLAQSQNDAAVAQASARSAQAQLRRLTGEPGPIDARLIASQDDVPPRLPLCDLDAQGEGAIEAALDRHPGVRRATQDVETGRFAAKGQRAALWPAVVLRLEQPVGHVPQGVTRDPRVSVLLSYTPDAGFSTSSRAAAGDQRVAALQAQVAATRQEIAQQVRSECADQAGFAERVTGHLQSRGYTRDVLGSYMRLFLAGKRGWLDVLNVAREDFENEQGAAFTLAALQASRYRVRILAGDHLLQIDGPPEDNGDRPLIPAPNTTAQSTP